ncbi:RagB/SusD family nutrient uptake outer membrane protein [Fulvivirgaceae bacterium BMA12]|uniref:RagB/SusD family nutrient uptake outer membrane protein n=1 Tax=Agaribacillus aureus TaxID=3051825 RepID=A0ABT8L9S6_9BACT|nr:RagB/SusD family nutrient uptake outer membrane protein [Fulvivirgaceae bacterium BMA12]
MKKILQIFIITLVLGAVLSSCEDILTEKPTSFLTPGTFPGSEKDAVAATNAAYSRLYSTIISFYYSFTPSDVAFQGQHNTRPVSYFVNLTSLNGDAVAMWRENYEGISRANTVIDFVPEVDMDVDLRARLVGEAKFLRAFYYFELVRIYGGVPILDQVLSGPDELQGIQRNTVAEVYTLIKQDLTEAMAVLPTVYPPVEAGRATKWAAASLLSKVHMTNQEWNEANELLKQIIDSGDFGLVANYESLFGQQAEHQLMPDKDGNLVNENIFDIQWEQDERNDFIQSWVGSRDVEVGGVTAVGGGWENMLPTQDFLAMFEPGDLRQDISYLTELDGNVLESPRTPGAGPITGKYLNKEGDAPKGNNGSQNTYVLRYADILLLRAEAENELNGPANAYTFINLVRERAGLPGLAGLDQEAFRQAIRKERATELSFEGHRKYDLLRWNIFVETIRNTTDPNMQIPRDNIQDFHVLLPVPQREIDISNGSIVQNTGYE